MAEGNIKVAVEAAVHNALRDALQNIADDHGIVVRGVSADWVNASSPGEMRFILQRLYIDSSTERKL